MAEHEKDHLANLLGQMADGHHDEEPGHEGHPHDVEETPGGPAQPPAAQTPAPGPRAAQRPAANTPTPQPAAQQPAAPAGKTGAQKPVAKPAPVVVPRAATPRPMATPQPATPASRKMVAPPPEMPAAASPAANEDLGVTAEPVDEDDQVIVPAPPVEALAHTPAHRPRPVPGPALNVEVKRTMIPVLLTIGAICIGVVLLGMASDVESPFRVFRELWFAVPVVVIGLLFLVGAIFTMFQVRNELLRRAAAGRP